MSGFDFISHESYPEDQYIVEAVTLCLEKKYRVTYVRKRLQRGGMFWGEISTSVTKEGERKYLKSFSQDSKFLEESIKEFLENRLWERQSNERENDLTLMATKGGYVAQKKKKDESDDEVPF